MPSDPLCQLTAMDMSVLEGMMDRLAAHSEADTAVGRLLRQKLAAGRVRFRDDIDPRVATINSRIQFRVGSGSIETCVLTHGGESALPGTALPISSLHGLALLGLMEGETITVECASSNSVVLQVVRVMHQPEAARLRNPRPALRLVTGDADGGARAGDSLLLPEDDDPGPHAA